MNVRKITVGNGTCARSVGAEAVRRALADALSQDPESAPVIPVGCDGACWAQPVVTVTRVGGKVDRYERVMPEACPAILNGTHQASPQTPDVYPRRLLGRVGTDDAEWLPDREEAEPYTARTLALSMAPEEVIALVKAAGLRGRGGAYFPIALKWESARQHPGPRYLVINAEEGEPGAYKDRHLMEGDPNLLIVGIAIAAHAIGCEDAYLYVNGQAEASFESLKWEMDGLMDGDGADSWQPPWNVRIHIYRGAGGYVCGEESVILNSIEGERAVPRPRPPLPTEAGLFGRPTVISNVETVCNLPGIILNGAEWFREVGTAEYPGTKLVSLSGAIQRPGLYEVPLGITTREVLALGGGLPAGRTLRAVVMGGPSGGFLSPELLDVPLTGGLVHPSGAVLGSGGMVVLDDRTPLSLALRELAAYNTQESCGKCTPCREGNDRALDILDRAADRGRLSVGERQELLDLCDLMQYASLCGLGQMAPGPIRSALTLFPDEV